MNFIIMTNLYIIFILVLAFKVFVCHGSHHHTCNHFYPRDYEVITGVHLERTHHISKRDVTQPLKINLSYENSVFRLPKAKYNLIKNTIIPKAVSFWQKALRVRNPETTIRLNRRCANNTAFFFKGDPRAYCKDSCEDKTMCGEVVIREEHLNECRVCNSVGSECRQAGAGRGKGIDGAHFVFYISALQTDRCEKGSTVAYAAHCQQEATLDRPIAGHVNLCPSSISLKEQDVQTILSTVKHEMLHALGFSISLYAFYRDDQGEPLTPRDENGKPPLNERLQTRQWSDRVIRTFDRTNWIVRDGVTSKEVHMVVTPRVVREARKHFDCEELEGAELEDQGFEGTALTHWEKRVYENEAMTGTYTQNPVYSRLTFALMEDTGWYFADYFVVQPLAWGFNQGCDFAMRSCKHWMDSKSAKGLSIHPFCDKVKRDPLQTECTDSRDSVALCNLVEYPNPLPFHYQNFEKIPAVHSDDLAKFGGSVALADYCPYIQEFMWKSADIVVRGSHCHFSENNPEPQRNFALEKYSIRSQCFNHAEEWRERTCSQVRHWQHWGSGCYAFTCHSNRLHIQVENYSYTCYATDQVIPISIFDGEWLHEGAILCPSCSELCQESGMACLNEPAPSTLQTPSLMRDSLDCGALSLRPMFLSSFLTLWSILNS